MDGLLPSHSSSLGRANCQFFIVRIFFTNKKSAPIIRKLVESATANAERKGEASGSEVDVDDLYVETITVDAGPSLRRFRPRARGRATKILKKTSHITVVLGTR